MCSNFSIYCKSFRFQINTFFVCCVFVKIFQDLICSLSNYCAIGCFCIRIDHSNVHLITWLDQKIEFCCITLIPSWIFVVQIDDLHSSAMLFFAFNARFKVNFFSSSHTPTVWSSSSTTCSVNDPMGVDSISPQRCSSADGISCKMNSTKSVFNGWSVNGGRTSFSSSAASLLSPRDGIWCLKQCSVLLSPLRSLPDKCHCFSWDLLSKNWSNSIQYYNDNPVRIKFSHCRYLDHLHFKATKVLEVSTSI